MPNRVAEYWPHTTPDPLTPHFRFGTQAGKDFAGNNEIFALRYAVYCIERGFLDYCKYGEGVESDEFDTRSAHFTAHNPGGDLVGSVRLVQASTTHGFPFERYCPPLFDGIQLPPAELSGEVSRLVVRRDYRRRAGDTLAGVSKEFLAGGAAPVPAKPPESARRSDSPELLLGLYREMYQYSLKVGIRYWYAAMERSLARALARFQFVFVPIGARMDYYGPVVPYLADLREMEMRLAASNPELCNWFRQSPTGEILTP